MNKRLIIVIVCMLLLTTFYTASGNINVKQMKRNPELALFDDVPVWEVGYSWTYAGGFHIEEEGIIFDITLIEAYFGVIDNAGSSYNVLFGGHIEGEFSVSDPSVGVILEDVSGNIQVTKSTLAFSEVFLSMTGMVTMEGVPFPVPGTIEITITYQQDLEHIEFPLAVGNSWTIPETEITMHVVIKVVGPAQEFETNGTAGGALAYCESQEDIICGPNSYNAYNISTLELSKFYAPSAGNFIKMVPKDDSIDFNMVMIATSYPNPDSPLKPDTPSGPEKGGIGEIYDFTTKAIDPNGDLIRYGWDWNGDMLPDEWTVEHNSNVEITTSHTWPSEGTYEIRVKARNSIGLESVWSDPLIVTMPRNKIINRPIFEFLQNQIGSFPILKVLLQNLGL